MRQPSDQHEFGCSEDGSDAVHAPRVCYIGQLAADSKSYITDSTYYNPGWRPSSHELGIYKDGIFLSLCKLDAKGQESGLRYKLDKIPFEKIKRIYYKNFKLFRKTYSSIEIETDDNRRGHVNLMAHPKRVVIYYLVKYLKSNWKNIYEGWN